ncbi:hypothetical protein PoB_007560700 [Plakobranchus ocellatus]|uniref:Uncharacterized protein n=1 Tax=Plakobranchus ocellatus TaxID=259542 RepID=A0AAV4DYK3_9GAST|nr:hypothetical protein PoB_007560700 [Plakobranchus ocellatus]
MDCFDIVKIVRGFILVYSPSTTRRSRYLGLAGFCLVRTIVKSLELTQEMPLQLSGRVHIRPTGLTSSHQSTPRSKYTSHVERQCHPVRGSPERTKRRSRSPVPRVETYTLDDDLEPPAAHGYPCRTRGLDWNHKTPLSLLTKVSIWFWLMTFYSWEAIQQWFPLASCWFVYGFSASLRLATNPQGSGDL